MTPATSQDTLSEDIKQTERYFSGRIRLHENGMKHPLEKDVDFWRAILRVCAAARRSQQQDQGERIPGIEESAAAQTIRNKWPAPPSPESDTPEGYDSTVLHGMPGLEVSESDTAEAYRPCVIELEDSGLSEFVMFDCATIYEESGGYQVIRDMETRQVIGFAWPTKAPPTAPVPQEQKQEAGELELRLRTRAQLQREEDAKNGYSTDISYIEDEAAAYIESLTEKLAESRNEFHMGEAQNNALRAQLAMAETKAKGHATEEEYLREKLAEAEREIERLSWNGYQGMKDRIKSLEQTLRAALEGAAQQFDNLGERAYAESCRRVANGEGK